MKRISIFALSLVAVMGIGSQAGATSLAPVSPVLESTFVTATCAVGTNSLGFYSPSGGVPVGTALCSDIDGTSDIGSFMEEEHIVGNFIVKEFESDPATITLANANAHADYVATLTGSYQVQPDFSSETSSGLLVGAGGSVTSMVAGIGAFLVTNLPVILAVLAALIGLGFLIRRVKMWIGKRA